MHTNPLDGFFKMIQYGFLILIVLLVLLGTVELNHLINPKRIFYTKVQPVVRYEVDTTTKDTTWVTYLKR